MAVFINISQKRKWKKEKTTKTKGRERKKRPSQSKKLTTGLFWMLRARFAYFKVLRVSSALISAGLMQAGKGQDMMKVCSSFNHGLIKQSTENVRKEKEGKIRDIRKP